jgi:hypothetical protein
MRYPYRMALSDSFIFILDLHPYEFFIHCFTYPDFHYYNSLCKKGNGPEEFILVHNIQCYKDTLFIYDSRNRIYSIDVHKISTAGNTFDYITLTNDYGFLTNGVRVENKFYYPIFNILNDGRVLTFDTEGNYLYSLGEIRLTEKREINAATCQAWISFLGGNENLIVAATQFGEVIDIFDADKKQHTIKGKGGDPVYQEYKGYAAPNGITGFEDVTVTERFIYAVYNGETMKERKEELQGGSQIYVFDYNGQPQQKITLDRRVMCIYIDEKKKILYALDVNSDYPLYTAQLPDN